MAIVSEKQGSSTRNWPIQPSLSQLLEKAATAAGIDEVRVYSGGQPPYPGKPRVGSTRHDLGWAADLQLLVDGKRVRFSDTKADPKIMVFVEAAAALGANGIGAGVDYMGPESLHVGFGTSPSDKRQLVWGAKGHSANAPDWLRVAAAAGWSKMAPAAKAKAAQDAAPLPAPYVTVARDGLRLRGGPGLEFDAIATLRVGTQLTVVEFVSEKLLWAKVDLESDGLVDGFVYAAYLELAGDGIEHDG